jgi:hypothetical protein
MLLSPPADKPAPELAGATVSLTVYGRLEPLFVGARESRAGVDPRTRLALSSADEHGDLLRLGRIGAELAMGAQLVELADAVDPVPVEAPVGRSRSPSRPTIGAIEIFDPFTEGRGLRRINRLEAIAARLWLAGGVSKCAVLSRAHRARGA